MTKIKKYLKPFMFFGGFIVLYLFILTMFNYFGVLKFNVIIKFNFALISVLTFIFGTFNGKRTSKKGYLEGIKWGLLIDMALFILNIIFYRQFNLTIFLYYFIILVSSIIGSIIGINLKKK